MSLGYTEGFRAFEAEITLGKSEGYAHGRQSHSGTSRGFACMGGNPSNGSEPVNQAPALADGKITKLINDVFQSGGGRLDIYSYVNGVPVLEGNNPSVSLVTLDFERDFVAGDLLGWASQRNSTNGTLEYTFFMEIQWDEILNNIQHWYGGLYIGLFGAGGSFWQVGEVSHNSIFPLSARTEFQNRFQKSGTILDFGAYGISPVGVDNVPVWELEINGIVESSQILTQHAGRVFDNFTGVNIPFNEGDLMDIHGVSANNAAVLEILPTMRIQFD